MGERCQRWLWRAGGARATLVCGTSRRSIACVMAARWVWTWAVPQCAPAITTCLPRWLAQLPGALLMRPHQIRRPVDRDPDASMRQPVQQAGGQPRVGQPLTPRSGPAVGTGVMPRDLPSSLPSNHLQPIVAAGGRRHCDLSAVKACAIPAHMECLALIGAHRRSSALIGAHRRGPYASERCSMARRLTRFCCSSMWWATRRLPRRALCRAASSSLCGLPTHGVLRNRAVDEFDDHVAYLVRQSL
jgi:hypothetical protein